MLRLWTLDPPADGGYPLDSDLHRVTDDCGPPAPDLVRGADSDWPDSLADWTPIAVAMPPEGVFVDTVTSNGRGLRVKWEGRLWRLPSGVHYPCFTPEYWRPEFLAAPPPVR